MSGLPTECSDVRSGRNTGWPKNREVHGHGAVVVVRPGEGPGQGEGPQDRRMPTARCARCTSATTERHPAAEMLKSVWKATCMESVHAWFGEGRMKKGRAIGTSSAAYSTVLSQVVKHFSLLTQIQIRADDFHRDDLTIGQFRHRSSLAQAFAFRRCSGLLKSRR